MCEIMVFHMPDQRAYGAPFPGGWAVQKCTTHDWTFQNNEPLTADSLCPIGRIEAATNGALARIEKLEKAQQLSQPGGAAVDDADEAEQQQNDDQHADDH